MAEQKPPLSANVLHVRQVFNACGRRRVRAGAARHQRACKQSPAHRALVVSLRVAALALGGVGAAGLVRQAGVKRDEAVALDEVVGTGRRAAVARARLTRAAVEQPLDGDADVHAASAACNLDAVGKHAGGGVRPAGAAVCAAPRKPRSVSSRRREGAPRPPGAGLRARAGHAHCGTCWLSARVRNETPLTSPQLNCEGSASGVTYVCGSGLFSSSGRVWPGISTSSLGYEAGRAAPPAAAAVAPSPLSLPAAASSFAVASVKEGSRRPLAVANSVAQKPARSPERRGGG